MTHALALLALALSPIALADPPGTPMNAGAAFVTDGGDAVTGGSPISAAGAASPGSLGQTADAADAGLIAGAQPASAERPGDDGAVLRELHAANVEEIREGQLAEQRATNSKVRRYGTMLIKDHTAADQLVSKCATKLGLMLTDALPADQQGHIGDLQSASGDTFDRTFVEMEIAGHAKVIEDLEFARRTMTDRDLRKLTDKLLPKLRAHEREAQKLSRALRPQNS